MTTQLKDMATEIRTLETTLAATANLMLERLASMRLKIAEAALELQPEEWAEPAPKPARPRRKDGRHQAGLSIIDCNPKVRPPLMRSYDFGVVEGGSPAA